MPALLERCPRINPRGWNTPIGSFSDRGDALYPVRCRARTPGEEQQRGEQYRLTRSNCYRGARWIWDVFHRADRSPFLSDGTADHRLRITAGISGPARPDVVQLVLRGGLGGGTLAVFAAALQSGQRGHHHGRPVDEEMPAGSLPGVGEPEAVGTQRDVVARHPRGDLVLHRPLPVAAGDHRPG